MAQKKGRSGPKNSVVAQKWPTSGPQVAQKWPRSKVAQSGPKNFPKVAQKVVNWPKSGPKVAQKWPKSQVPKKVAQTSSVWPIEYGKSGPNPNKRVKVAQKRVFGGPSGPTTKFFLFDNLGHRKQRANFLTGAPCTSTTGRSTF